MCTSSDTLHLPSFLIYVLFAERTESVFYDESFVLSHPIPQGLVFDLPSEGVSQMLSTLIRVICGEADATITVDSTLTPVERSSKPVKMGSFTSQRREYSTTTPNIFKYMVVVGDMKIFVKTKRDLDELRRDLKADKS